MIDFFSINLRKQSELPVYQQLGEVLYSFIEKGVLKAGNKLPSIRELSKSLNINNDTVINAYKFLEKRKAVYSIKGSGTYISDLQRNVSGVIKDEAFENKTGVSDINNFYNMYGTNVSKKLFPSNPFKYILAELIDSEKGNCFVSDNKNTGDTPVEIKNILLKQKNIEIKDSRFFYTDGSEHAAYVLKSIARAGESVIGIGFVSAGLIEKIISMGCEFYKFDICEKIDIEAFEKTIKMHKPSAVYILTNANPSVSYLSNEDKKTILSLAGKYAFYVVEDDSFGFINYPASAAAFAFKSFDCNKNVVYIYSFQKASIPGLPIGFMLLPSQIEKPEVISPSPVIKKSFEKFLLSGFVGYTNELREIFFQKLKCITDSMMQFERVTVYIPKGGCAIWLKFADAETADYICNALLTKKIVVTPGKLHSNEEFFGSLIQIGFGETEYLDINYCMKEVTDIIRSVLTIAIIFVMLYYNLQLIQSACL